MRVISSASGLVPVHVRDREPGSEQEPVRSGYGRQRFPRVPGGLDWQKHGLQPRWLGTETSDCAVAVQPGSFHNRGTDERDRFLAGARRRGELALVVAMIGEVDDDSPRGPLSHLDWSVSLSTMFTSVNGRRLPTGTRPDIAPDLGSADRDLALRLLARPADAPWWSLHLRGVHMERVGGLGSEYHEAEGELQPILVDALGDPVVAAWVPPSGDQRWYIIPDATDWNTILGWLIQRALPEYVPGALRRARSPHFADPDLQTPEEVAARKALDDLTARYTEEKVRLEQALREAETRAEPVRYGLLYGTGDELKRAVAHVLTDAGLRTVDLDEQLGGTRSADLLVTAGGAPGRLVEVKAASGAAGEHLVADLQRHLTTWPQLRPDEPVAGGVLIVNHQHRLHPSERAEQVYSRPEFVAALSVTVVSTVRLFRWWRAADWTAIHTSVLGHDTRHVDTAAVPTEAAGGPGIPGSRRRWWRSGQGR